MTWNISFYDLLLLRVYDKKSDVILMDLPLYVTCLFSFAVFKILSLFYIVCVLIIIGLGVFIFQSCLFDILKDSHNKKSLSFLRLGKFSDYIIEQIICAFSSYLFSFFYTYDS
jgi:hypothetical protein